MYISHLFVPLRQIYNNIVKMKRFLLMLLCVFAALIGANAKQFVNLTPLPKQMIVNEGQYTLPKSYTIGAALLADSLQKEAMRFAEAIQAATGCKGKLTKSKKADIMMIVDASIAHEGYQLSVTTKGISIR